MRLEILAQNISQNQGPNLTQSLNALYGTSRSFDWTALWPGLDCEPAGN